MHIYFLFQISIEVIVPHAFGLFNRYKDLCSLIEYMLQLQNSGIWNPLRIFIYMSLFKYPCKYAITTSMRRKSNPSKTVKQIIYLNMVASIIGEYVSL